MSKTLGLAVIVAASAISPALAQPGVVYVPAPAPAPAAPQTDDWGNVSHINGTPVPVGERGDYLYETGRRTIISSNPIGWLLGIYGVSVTHAVGPNVAVRGDANLFSDEDMSGYEVGASVPIYFKRVFQGPFLEPGVIVRDLDDDDGQRASIGPSVVVGWHWTFDSGLNAAVAIGLMRDVGSDAMDEYDSESDIEPSGYFRVGYAF